MDHYENRRGQYGGDSRNSRARELRRRRRRRRAIRNRIIFGCVLVLLIVGIVFLIRWLFGGSEETPPESVNVTAGSEENGEAGTGGDGTDAAGSEAADWQAVLAEADIHCQQYNYDVAIEMVQSVEGYENIPELTEAIARYEDEKSKAVPYDKMSEITHVFYHTLVIDGNVTFHLDDANKVKDYNQVMTTIDEFNKITQEMYDRGYVLVDLHDIAHLETQPDGTEKMVWGTIYLPEGKTPFVLSQDDVSYYEYMEGDGFASRLVIDEDGGITNEIDQEDGTVIRGSYDMVPLLEDFIADHPDFSYRGARGIIALTGYNGILGYRTAPKYGDPTDSSYKEEYASIDVESERQKATEVAARMQELGWRFASHSWGHRDYGALSFEEMQADAQKWEEQVEPLLGGDIDTIIFPFGADLGTGSWRGYDHTEAIQEKYQYLDSLGFDYYCPVDGAQYWTQMKDGYFRQGRRNLDGIRMWWAVSGEKDTLSDLFDASKVFDPSRPTPVEDL